ncbi:hypothetical protein [Hydrogenobacter thermophilus]|uniref:hypothetical protein n=1 Tax=Hydrogenobacter thermophilus TaxID=940 RepID=UPI0030F65E0D
MIILDPRFTHEIAFENIFDLSYLPGSLKNQILNLRQIWQAWFLLIPVPVIIQKKASGEVRKYYPMKPPEFFKSGYIYEFKKALLTERAMFDTSYAGRYYYVIKHRDQFRMKFTNWIGPFPASVNEKPVVDGVELEDDDIIICYTNTQSAVPGEYAGIYDMTFSEFTPRYYIAVPCVADYKIEDDFNALYNAYTLLYTTPQLQVPVIPTSYFQENKPNPAIYFVPHRIKPAGAIADIDYYGKSAFVIELQKGNTADVVAYKQQLTQTASKSRIYSKVTHKLKVKIKPLIAVKEVILNKVSANLRERTLFSVPIVSSIRSSIYTLIHENVDVLQHSIYATTDITVKSELSATITSTIAPYANIKIMNFPFTCEIVKVDFATDAVSWGYITSVYVYYYLPSKFYDELSYNTYKNYISYNYFYRSFYPSNSPSNIYSILFTQKVTPYRVCAIQNRDVKGSIAETAVYAKKTKQTTYSTDIVVVVPKSIHVRLVVNVS